MTPDIAPYNWQADVPSYDWHWTQEFEWVDPSTVITDDLLEVSSDTNPRTQRHELRSFLRFVGVIAIANLATVGYVRNSDPLLIPKTAVGYFKDKDCGKTPTNEMKTVQSLLYSLAPNRIDAQEARTAVASERKEYAKTQAQEQGLTLIDDAGYRARLDQARTSEEILEIVNEYTENYGFTVRIHSKKDNEDTAGDTTLAKDDIDPERLRSGAKSLMDTFYLIPLEVVKASKLHQIKIYRVIGGYNIDAASSYPSFNMKITEKSFYDGDPFIYAHELGHMIDFNVCGIYGSSRDPEYNALNPPHFEYGDTKDKASQRYVALSYGLTSVVEDKGTMFEGILAGLNPDLYVHGSTPVREKFSLLLARVERKVPGSAAYLSAISTNP